MDIEDLHYVTEAGNLESGERIIVDVEGREVAVFNVKGEYYALANYCVHQGGPVCEGLISGTLSEDEEGLKYEKDDEVVACPWHGWEFDIKTGEHLARKKYKLPSYNVVVHEETIYVDL